MKKKLGGSSRARRVGVALLGVAGLAVALVIPATSFADNASGCDFAATGTTESCSGPLAGSTFAGGDGNLLTSPTTFGTTDWQNVAGRNTGIDLPSGTTDNAFGQGTKEDDPNVSVVTGSIPPSKSDLTRFYEASQFANNSNFLYLGWERTNNLGSANMDFEINQKAQPDLTTTGPATLNRTAGDLLVTFDFTNGGGTPTLGLLTWVTTGSTSQCFSSNSLPCWGNHQTLNGTDSIGAVNNLDAVTDPFVSNTPNNIGALRFGETAINLTAAGVFPPGTCEAFGSAFVKSRSSASFPAEVKDFVAPVPVNISNCGEVKIIKHTDPRGLNQAFNYTSTIPNPAAGVTPPTPNCTADTTPSAFTLNDNGNTTGDNGANTEDCTNVPANSYTVTEGTEPPNFTLESLTCTATGTGSSGSQHAPGSPQADITVAPNGVVTCTYQNKGSSPSSLTTAQSFLPNDSATVTNAGFGNLAGTVTFTAYPSADCSGTAIFTQNVTVSGASSQTVSTTNTTHSTTASNVSWKVSYTSTNTPQQGISANCLENTALTINNDGTASSS